VFDFRQGQEIFLFSIAPKQLLVAHPAFYTMRRGGFFPGAKQMMNETDHLVSSSAEVKLYLPPPHTSSWREFIKHKSSSTFTLFVITFIVAEMVQ
jgi:hypothetical protein